MTQTMGQVEASSVNSIMGQVDDNRTRMETTEEQTIKNIDIDKTSVQERVLVQETVTPAFNFNFLCHSADNDALNIGLCAPYTCVRVPNLDVHDAVRSDTYYRQCD